MIVDGQNVLPIISCEKCGKISKKKTIELREAILLNSLEISPDEITKGLK
jgi:hypothetical protein